MRAIRFACPLVLAGCMLYPTTGRAQSATSGAIAGEVRDGSGAVVPGVTVEASSPALIEKVRSVVSDERGAYRIIDLRPGPYTVTFTLPGFGTVRREGIELTTAFTARIDAVLQPSAIEESVTITGQSPVVDVQNVRSENMLTRQVLDTVPTAKNAAGYAVLTLGAVASRDVGGNAGDRAGRMAIHGGHADGITTFDGLNTHTVKGNGDRRMHSNQEAVQEVAVETGGMSAEAETGGPAINIVPKEGGNRFSGVTDFAWAGESMQSDNFSQELQDRGLTQPNRLIKIYDIGGAVGGPIKKDKLWFYFASRSWGAQDQYAGIFYNKLQGASAGSPVGSTMFYQQDTSHPAYNDFPVREPMNLRVTWQATQRHKFNFTAIPYQRSCQCSLFVTATRAPEATWNGELHNALYQANWTFPATGRLLFQAGFMGRDDSGITFHPDGETKTDRAIQEASTGLWYGSMANASNPFFVNGDTWIVDFGTQTAHYYLTRGAMSYVTGSHSFKTGFSTQNGFQATGPNGPNYNEAYQFRNQVPTGLWEIGGPGAFKSTMGLNLGIYAQDQWTLGKATINAGVRYDSIDAYAPAQTRPGGYYIPETSFAEVKHLPNWKDITPRMGLAYDLFGNGKTAIKASLGKYMTAVGVAIATAVNPPEALAGVAFRTWNDSLFGPGDTRSGNFIPDCTLKDPGVNGECGAINNTKFGTPSPTLAYDPKYLNGWGKRGYEWMGSVGWQQELTGGVALNVSYYRTWWGNFTVTDNTLVTPADYDTYSLTAPINPQLPGGGGYLVSGLWDLKPTKLGQVANVVKAASDFGKRTEIYNGGDVGINARFRAGGLLFGGVSIGRTDTNSCAVTPDSPQNQFCDSQSWINQVKLAVSYPLPWWGLQTSATFQNLPGVNQTAAYLATNAQIAPSLGRNLGACGFAATCTQSATVQLIRPDSQREPRQNQLDFRISSTIKIGVARLRPMLDIFNLLNANDVQTLNNTYGTSWLRPTTILAARTFKIGASFDF